MRIPLPPNPQLSASGNLAAVCKGDTVTFLSIPDGDVRSLKLAHEARLVSLGPEDKALVAGPGWLSLMDSVPPYEVHTTVEISGSLFRLAWGNDGKIAGVIRSEDNRAHLCVWEGMDLVMNHPQEGYSLEEMVPFFIGPPDSQSRIFLSGTEGPGGFEGGSYRFWALVQLDGDKLAHLWDGEGMPFEPDIVLVVPGTNRVVMHARHDLVQIAMEPDGEKMGNIIRHLQGLPAMEQSRLSPNGDWIVCASGGGSGSPMIIHSMLLGTDSELMMRGELNVDGLFPALAIDDEGAITVVWGTAPDHIQFACSDYGNEFSEPIGVKVPWL